MIFCCSLSTFLPTSRRLFAEAKAGEDPSKALEPHQRGEAGVLKDEGAEEEGEAFDQQRCHSGSLKWRDSNSNSTFSSCCFPFPKHFVDMKFQCTLFSFRLCTYNFHSKPLLCLQLFLSFSLILLLKPLQPLNQPTEVKSSKNRSDSMIFLCKHILMGESLNYFHRPLLLRHTPRQFLIIARAELQFQVST